MDSIPTVLVRVHVSSSTDARSVVSLQVPHHLTAKDLFLHICSKRKYDPKEYTVRLADGRTELSDVDKTLEKLKVTEFSIVPKGRRSGMFISLYFK
jgi:hypothetical protein